MEINRSSRPPETGENFIGDVWFGVSVPAITLSAAGRHRAVLPGARAAIVANGRTRITEGRGFVRARGGPVIEVRPGDTIHPARGVALARCHP